jgi:hypothetical protein
MGWRAFYCCVTGERIKNLRPLAVMRMNVYREAVRAKRCSAPSDVRRDIVEISLVTLFLLAVAVPF